MSNSNTSLSPISALHLFRKNRGSKIERSLSKELCFLRTIFKKILQQFGELHNFNDNYYLGLVERALEVIRFNDWKGESRRKGLELNIFQFIMTSLGEDLQNLLCFYYSLEFLKVGKLVSPELWNHFLEGDKLNKASIDNNLIMPMI
jgi:hypothetical protein